MNAVLLMNANHVPIKIIHWHKAVSLYLSDKVRIVEAYHDKVIRSASGFEMPWPAVVALKAYAQMSRKAAVKVRLSRAHVLARDAFKCAYCGVEPKTEQGLPDINALSIDHIIPRSRAVNGMLKTKRRGKIPVTCWQNVVCSCKPCNHRKADRTPREAGMKLLFKARRPNRFDVVRIVLARRVVPAEWRDHLI